MLGEESEPESNGGIHDNDIANSVQEDSTDEEVVDKDRHASPSPEEESFLAEILEDTTIQETNVLNPNGAPKESNKPDSYSDDGDGQAWEEEGQVLQGRKLVGRCAACLRCFYVSTA